MIFAVLGAVTYYEGGDPPPSWPVRYFDDFEKAKGFAGELVQWFIDNAEMRAPYAHQPDTIAAYVPSAVYNEMDPLLHAAVSEVYPILRIMYYVVPFPEAFEAPLTIKEVRELGNYVILWDAFDGVEEGLEDFLDHPLYGAEDD
jgi:hypothetical protein